MKDTFLDINTSQPFNGDPPYIFRFEEGQSIGLNYIKKICMVTDMPQATIRTEPNQTVFRILKMDQNIPNNIETIKMNLKVYAELDKLIAEDNEWICDGFRYVTSYQPISPDQPIAGLQDLTPASWVFVYVFYILGRAEDPGEYLGKFWINDREYRISADFYAENEVLKENLKNFESKLPESIQKAIYENNVHEELNDNILINRKNKELLMQYMDIMGNKGSYESLLNSINWFEWGDLLRLEEFWKRYINDDLDYDYFATELNHQLTPEDIRQLSNHVKSTFIGLYCTLCKLREDNGSVLYQDSLGRDNIQSPTSWQDTDASNTVAPSDLYEDYPELEPAQIGTSGGPVQGAQPAELTVETPMTPQELSDWQPGTMQQTNAPIAGDWARIENEDGTVQWEELIDEQTWPAGDSITYWSITYNYIFNEQMPDMIRQLALWSGQDLSLKMTVLGNFFSSFFMPIHLDLIHSCIEYWAFSYALKLIYTQSVDEKAFVNAMGSLDMIWESDLKIAPHPETMSYIDTLFRNFNSEKVFGFSTDPSRHEEILASVGGNMEEYNKDILRYIYKGECCPVRFIGKLYSGSLDQNISIYRQKLLWCKEGDSGVIDTGVVVYPNEEYVEDPICVYESGHYYRDGEDFVEIDDANKENLRYKRAVTYHKEMVFNLDFNVGFKEEGDYVIFLEFFTPNNRIYTKKFNISISDFMHDRIEVLKLVPAKKKVWSENIPPLDLYQYMRVGKLPDEFKDSDIFLQSHFFTANRDGDAHKAGLNHTLIGIVEKNYPFDGDTEFDPDMDKTIWTDGETSVDASTCVDGEFEGTTWKWVDENDNQAVWQAGLDPEKWPEEWGEYTEDRSHEMDGQPIPDTLISGTLNNILNELEEKFPEYWWSWDRIQISKRDNTIVKIDTPFNPLPKGNIVKKQYPDEYPGQ